MILVELSLKQDLSAAFEGQFLEDCAFSIYEVLDFQSNRLIGGTTWIGLVLPGALESKAVAYSSQQEDSHDRDDDSAHSF